VRGEGTPGRLTIRGDATSEGDRTPGGIRVVARDLILSDLLRDVRAPIPLALSVTVAPGSLSPREMDAHADLDVPRLAFARHSYGPLHFECALAAGRLRELAMSLPVPGARLSAQGGTSDQQTTVTTRFVVERLATLRAALASLDVKVPRLQGRGSLVVTARGDNVTVTDLAGWSVALEASLPQLSVSGSQYRGIALHASLPQLAPDRQTIALAASLAAPLPVTVALSASSRQAASPPLDESHPRVDVELQRLQIRYPGTAWNNEGPASLTAAGDTLSLRNLRLRAGAQTLAVNFARDARKLSADLRVESLRLQALPGMRARKIAGTLDAAVTALGTPAAPRVDADVVLRNGRMAPYEGLSARIVATVAEDHTVSATARAAMAGIGHLDATVHGPATWPPPPDAPLAATIDARNLRLGRLPLPPPAQVTADGVLGAHLDLRGTMSSPVLAVKIGGKNVRIERRGGGSDRPALGFRTVDVLVSYASPSLLGTVALDDEHRGTLRARVRTRIPAADLTTPARLALGQRPLDGALELKNMNPEGMSALVPTLQVVRGEITAAFAIRGTVAKPDVGGEINWRKGDLVVVKNPDQSGQEKGDDRKVSAQ
jgi:autotransporter translocation and assembly factor TamB